MKGVMHSLALVHRIFHLHAEKKSSSRTALAAVQRYFHIAELGELTQSSAAPGTRRVYPDSLKMT